MILYTFSKQSTTTSSTPHLKCLNNQHISGADEVHLTRTDMTMTMASSWACPSVTFVFLEVDKIYRCFLDLPIS